MLSAVSALRPLKIFQSMSFLHLVHSNVTFAGTSALDTSHMSLARVCLFIWPDSLSPCPTSQFVTTSSFQSPTSPVGRTMIQSIPDVLKQFSALAFQWQTLGTIRSIMMVIGCQGLSMRAAVTKMYFLTLYFLHISIILTCESYSISLVLPENEFFPRLETTISGGPQNRE